MPKLIFSQFGHILEQYCSMNDHNFIWRCVKLINIIILYIYYVYIHIMCVTYILPSLKCMEVHQGHKCKYYGITMGHA